MTDAEALETLVARTGNGRFRLLVARNPAAWWPVVRAAADPDAPPPPPLAPLVSRARRCPHWSPGRSCCDGWLCSRDPDEPRVVSIAADCAACPDLPG